MDRTIKFIWDYYGDPACKTAEHHMEHLKEFAEAKSIDIAAAGWEKLGDTRAVAFILLKEDLAHAFKNILRPNRAVIVKENEAD